MKYIICVISFILVSCSQTRLLSSDMQEPKDMSLFYIQSIDCNDFLYIINAQRNDSIFQIISMKNNIRSKSEDIVIKEKYYLDLKLVYPMIYNIEEKESAIDSCFLSLNRKSHYSLYIARNLDSLTLTENENNTENKLAIYSIICDACKNKRILLRLYIK